jgi:hypothetical protein
VDYHSDEEGPAQPFLVHEIVNGESVEVYRSPSRRFRGESLTIAAVARALAEAMRAVEVDTDVALVAHSLGGLVARQLVYAHYDELLDAGRRVSEVVTLGTPHQGALFDPLGPAFHDLQGAFSCSQVTRLLTAGTVARVALLHPLGLIALAFVEITDPGHLEALAALATGPAARRFLWQNCQMEHWQIALRDAPGAFVDDRDFPQIHWVPIAGTGHDVVPLDSPPLAGDGIVPASSALGIRADAKAQFVAGHSDLYADAQAVERVKREIGLEAPACDDGRDNDGDGLSTSTTRPAPRPRSRWSRTDRSAASASSSRVFSRCGGRCVDGAIRSSPPAVARPATGMESLPGALDIFVVEIDLTDFDLIAGAQTQRVRFAHRRRGAGNEVRRHRGTGSPQFRVGAGTSGRRSASSREAGLFLRRRHYQAPRHGAFARAVTV